MARRTVDAAAALGPGYSAIPRDLYSKIENDHEGARLTTYKQRAVLAGAFGVSTDDLSAYLDERRSLDELLSVRSVRQPLAHQENPAPRRYGDHPDWERLVREAREEDPELTDETFQELAAERLFSVGFNILTPRVVAQQARILQNFRAKTRRSPD